MYKGYQVTERVNEFGTPLTNWYQKNIVKMANDNYYNEEEAVEQREKEQDAISDIEWEKKYDEVSE